MATEYGPSNIDPAEWKWLGNFYQGESIETHTAFAEEHDELQRNLAGVLGFDVGEDLWSVDGLWDSITFHRNGGCASCGSRFLYGSVFVRGERELLAVGHDCANGLFGLTDLSQKTKRRAAKARERSKIRAKFEAQVEADPELKAAFELLFDGDPVDHPKDGTVLQGSGGGIVSDIRGKGRRYGSISERQADLVKKIAREHHEWNARKAEEAEERGPVDDVPEGRVEIVGTVISHRWDEGYYGSTHKMLVEAEEGRWRVWGSVPSKIDDEIYTTQFNEEGWPISGGTLEGSKVSFTASVEPSKDDSTFGFYKRPTKPVLIEAGKEEE